MKNIITYIAVKTEPGSRLARAQDLLEKSIADFGLESFQYPAGKELVFFGDVLRAARDRARGGAFVWCNSDLILTRDPFDVPDPRLVYGFCRREIPSREINPGIDMFYIPTAWWDHLLSHDVPSLYAGASYVDRWIPTVAGQLGLYENLIGYIDHPTHPRSLASGKQGDRYYEHNFRAFNKWAKRNHSPLIPAPPYLIPGLGRVWGVRDALRRWSELTEERRAYLNGQKPTAVGTEAQQKRNEP
jgi:hypothetical protein